MRLHVVMTQEGKKVSRSLISSHSSYNLVQFKLYFMPLPGKNLEQEQVSRAGGLCACKEPVIPADV